MTQKHRATIGAMNAAATVPVRERIERLVRDVKAGAIIGYDGPQEYWSTRMGSEASAEIAHLLDVAPELLEALRLAGQSAGFQYMTRETRLKIDNAIAKAEGRSNSTGGSEDE